MQINDFVIVKKFKEQGRVTAKFGNRYHVSNMNAPFCGSICGWFNKDELEPVPEETHDNSQPLTESQQNLIKDILKAVGRDDELNSQMAKAVSMTQDQFDEATDEIFLKLGNGRVTIEN